MLNSNLNKSKLLRGLKILTKWLVTFGIASYLIYHRKDFADLFLGFSFNVFLQNIFLFLVIFILIFLNYGLEALKWKWALQPGVNISLLDASKAIYSGVALSLVSPHAIGDYLARVAYLKEKKSLKYIPEVAICRISQLLVTAVVGLIGLTAFPGVMKLVVEYKLWFGGLLLLFSLLVFLSVFNNWFSIRQRFLRLDKLKVLAKVQLAAFFRYFVFLIQFFCALKIFQPGLESLLALKAVSVVFLLKSTLPSINFLGDLGIREFSVHVVFDQLMLMSDPAVLSSLLIWLANVLIPSTIGLGIIWLHKKLPLEKA